MENLKEMTLEVLVDQLAFYTKEHLKMMREGAMESEYQACKKMLHLLTNEIESRKGRLPGKTNSKSGDGFNSATMDEINN